jgi:flagellar biosynthesis regulator FlbT
MAPERQTGPVRLYFSKSVSLLRKNGRETATGKFAGK